MASSFGILALLNCIGLGLAATFGIALASRRKATQADRLLGVLSLAVAAFILGAVLLSTRLILQFPNLSFVHDPFEFTYAPLLYLYCRSSRTHSPLLTWRDSLHFVPALICCCVLIPWYVLPASAKLPVLQHAYETTLPWFAWRSAAVLGQGVLYLAAILIPHRGREDAFQAVRPRVLIWLSITALILGCMRLLSFYGIFKATQLQENLIIPLLASTVMGYFVVSSLRLSPAEIQPRTVQTPVVARRVPDRASEQLRTKLLDLMETQQPFRDARLNLHRLAELIGVPPRVLSELVNREFGQNVTDFINKHRIEEAKRLLVDPRYLNSTLLAVADDVGFGSKSSFNLTFKKHTSMTPTEFRSSAVS